MLSYVYYHIVDNSHGIYIISMMMSINSNNDIIIIIIIISYMIIISIITIIMRYILICFVKLYTTHSLVFDVCLTSHSITSNIISVKLVILQHAYLIH